jgi:hypothetical protein
VRVEVEGEGEGGREVVEEVEGEGEEWERGEREVVVVVKSCRMEC